MKLYFNTQNILKIIKNIYLKEEKYTNKMYYDRFNKIYKDYLQLNIVQSYLQVYKDDEKEKLEKEKEIEKQKYLDLTDYQQKIKDNDNNELNNINNYNMNNMEGGSLVLLY